MPNVKDINCDGDPNINGGDINCDGDPNNNGGDGGIRMEVNNQCISQDVSMHSGDAIMSSEDSQGWAPQTNYKFSLNYILWNVRGAGARSFPSLIRGIAHSFGVDFVALFETRCSGSKAHRIANMMGFPNFKIIDADGFKGGIWCLWSTNLATWRSGNQQTNSFISISAAFEASSGNDICVWVCRSPFHLETGGVESRGGSSLGYNFLARDLSDAVVKHLNWNWNTDLSWAENIDQFTTACKHWNKQVFGHTNATKKQLLGRLNGITRTESRFGLSMELKELQRSLWRREEEVLTQESLIWAQKSRSEWVVDGDRNTRYFHARANGRRKRNYIGALKGSDECRCMSWT
ncbi:hypothetical protein K1719_047292 [Acacia pycnantha]|nr:hypothetical protein K1719_047292 [Acacia pycnantha]